MMSLKRLLKRQSMITSWIKAGFWKWNIRGARQAKLMSGDLETPPQAPQLKGAEYLSSSWFLPSGTSLQAPFSSPCISASHAHLAKPRPTAHLHPSSWALLGKGHTSLLTHLTWNPWLWILGAFSHSSGCPPHPPYLLLPCQSSLPSSPLPLLPPLLQTAGDPAPCSIKTISASCKAGLQDLLVLRFSCCLANGRGQQETGGWSWNGSSAISLPKDTAPARQPFLHYNLSLRVLIALLPLESADPGLRVAPLCC